MVAVSLRGESILEQDFVFTCVVVYTQALVKAV